MKKALRYLLSGFAVVVLLIGAGALFIQLRGIPTYDKPVLQQSVEIHPQRIARGKKLATMLCAGCHMNAETKRLTGKHMSDAPPVFGEIHAPNITQDKTYGIGEWTDGEIIYLLRTGIKRDGSYAPPYMAKLPHMSDEDIASIVAFLRSDDEMVRASEIPSVPSQPSFMTKFLSTIEFKPLPFPTTAINIPDSTDLVAYGRYLTVNLDCWTCHSGDFTKLDVMVPENSYHFLAGGNKMLDLKGKELLTMNLTPDKETGIGNWTEEQFIKAVKYGMKDGEPALRYPMMPYPQLTDYEAKAIFAYLQTVPPVNNPVKRSSM
ncbi:c-type cytochrome [Cesiribacter sp. SM1]|uniref:c-type cytochrome n=1 Tax=Cesiribacter sp. SM1 TaxID=2861196 RepID=UPI001CD76815|nr:c-type cytochrome [Cesiribacter sp. SM1]